MIGNILLGIGLLVIVCSYMRIILIYFKTRGIEHKDMNGFDIAKELTSSYDEINIVKARDVRNSKYHIKRKVIKLNNRDYDGNYLYSLAVSSCLAGYSLINLHKDKYFRSYSSIFAHIGYLDYSVVIGLLISLFTNTAGDAKIGLILLGIILIYQYFRIQIATVGHEGVVKPLKKLLSKHDYMNVEKVLQIFLSLNTISFIVTLIFMLREVLIIMNF